MMRIAVTCRVDPIRDRDERRDALDQRWHPLLRRCGLTAIIVPNDESAATAIVAEGCDGVLLSGGNDIAPYGDEAAWAPERDRVERLLLDYARRGRLPVLGVCRGMQMINLFLGGGLAPATGHVGKRHRIHADPALPAEVNSFHNLAIPRHLLASELEVRATAEDGTVEAFSHGSLGWFGVMWHPERETEAAIHDLQLLQQVFRA